MDPDEALKQIREEITRFHESEDDRIGAAEHALELFENLDSWMSRGGFIPRAWATGRT